MPVSKNIQIEYQPEIVKNI